MRNHNIYHNQDGALDKTAGYALRRVQIQETNKAARAAMQDIQQYALSKGYRLSASFVKLTDVKTGIYTKIGTVWEE